MKKGKIWPCRNHMNSDYRQVEQVREEQEVHAVDSAELTNLLSLL